MQSIKVTILLVRASEPVWMYVQCSERLHLGELLELLEAGLEKTRVKKKPNPVSFSRVF